MDADEVAYRRNVRNMSMVLAAMVITIFAALVVPPYINPYHEAFQSSVSFDSPFGFTLHLKINSTYLPRGGTVLLSAWANSTSASLENVTAVSHWVLPAGRLWGSACNQGWPIGLGLMRGHYSQDNFTAGSLIPTPYPSCIVQNGVPSYYIFEPHSSKVLVTVAGKPQIWLIQDSLPFKQPSGGLLPGVYTVILADEWGDVLVTNFRAG